MLNLFDYLSDKDNKIIENYITSFGTAEDYIGNEKYLKYWAQNNKSLFRLLGGKLIYKVPYEYDKDIVECRNDLSKLLEDDFVHHYTDIVNTKIYKDHFEVYWQLKCLVRLDSLVDGTAKVDFKIKLNNNNKTLQISHSMKIMKAIQKVLYYFPQFKEDKKIFDLFTAFQNRYSMILNDKHIKCNICLSIHPMDFMTMSDNANKWSSCMSWREEGCYHAGTVEMMNSNNVICAYLDSSTPFVFKTNVDNEEEYTWNNKKWRQLFICTKEIIVGGKAYPYANSKFTIKILEILRELAKINWNHEYKYGIEPYKDMIHVGSAYRMENQKLWIKNHDTKKHNIIFDTKGMYNDMLNDRRTVYYCIRNKVKKNTIISYSGPAICLCCGEPLIKEAYYDLYEEDAYNARYDNTGCVICSKCKDDKCCDVCDDYGRSRIRLFNGSHICENCWNKVIKFCPDCGKIFEIHPAWNDDNLMYIPHSAGPELYEEDAFYENNNDKIVSRYCACPDCLKKIKNSSLVHRIDIHGRYCPMSKLVFKKTYDINDKFVQDHIQQNLISPPFKDISFDI